MRTDGGREFQILGAATLKPGEPNDVFTDTSEHIRFFIFYFFFFFQLLFVSSVQ